MNKKIHKNRLIALFLIFSLLICSLPLCLCSCSSYGGSTDIKTAQELAENVARGTSSEYDYIWKYLDEWDFPRFNASRVKEAEYVFYKRYYEAVEPSYENAVLVAANFLTQRYAFCPLTDAEAVTDAIIVSFLDALADRHTIYRTSEEYESYKNSMSGVFVGIGISVTSDEDGNIKVNSVYEDSPSEESGILAGDVITAVDGTAVSEVGYEEALGRIGGEADTQVTLTVRRGDSVFDLTVTRRTVIDNTVTFTLEDGIGYIRITSFKSSTAEKFKDAIDYMEQNGARGIIYDLRSNGGGYLNTVVEMIAYISSRGTEITSFSNGYSEPRIDGDNHELRLPSVVITNENTASAAELFTSALKDFDEVGYLDAVQVGKTTYGKGIMQSTYGLSGGASMTLTTAYYNSPLGKNYHGVGLTPDVFADDETALATAYEQMAILLNK